MVYHSGKYTLFILTGIFIFLSGKNLSAQYKSQFHLRWTEATERASANERIIRNVIYKSLEEPLDSTTEDLWEGAFSSMEVVNYRDSFTAIKIQEAIDRMTLMSIGFQRSVLETAFTLYPGRFITKVDALLKTTAHPKIFAMCAVYLLQSDNNRKGEILETLSKNFGNDADDHPILSRLKHAITAHATDELPGKNILKSIFSKDFLPGTIVVYSLQRRDRDYSGIVIVRKKDGSFVTKDGTLFGVPQLARGVSGLPYYLTHGNTPQGIYRMYGFGVSKNQLIGPTANIQMGMPVELNPAKFFDNEAYRNKEWTKEDYARLLPLTLKNFDPLYQSYYAGLAGRTEIIAHGTTINPEYYKDRPYYPLTPTEGCLSTREIWDGKLVDSDQEKLVNALLEAGGATGYLVVLDLDDRQMPVSMDEIQSILSEQKNF